MEPVFANDALDHLIWNLDEGSYNTISITSNLQNLSQASKRGAARASCAPLLAHPQGAAMDK